jgi:hypothetical protein
MYVKVESTGRLDNSGQRPVLSLTKDGAYRGRVWSLATVSVRGQSGRERVWPVKRSNGPRWQPADVRRPTTLYEKGTVKPQAGVAYLKPFGTIEESHHPRIMPGTSCA